MLYDEVIFVNIKSGLFFGGALVMAVVIFCMSSFNGTKSSQQSWSLVKPVVRYLASKCSVETTTKVVNSDNAINREAETEITTKSSINIFRFEKNSKGRIILSKEQWRAITQGINKFARKSAHVFMYFLLTLFFIAGFSNINSKLSNYYILFSLLCNLVYAVTDEVHQIFTDRTSTVGDVFIDLFGGLVSVAVYILVKKSLIKKEMRKIQNEQ